ncbi:ribosomal RNA small subunit methyltransferase A [Oxobacter pfennigii]|uniref:Ribosomal RNA small subunit methyltransferase A n=2 Tax=Oxobacter pfennigii TaxID=36849 RepID=A0A0N8NSV5_9CLOT|nr:ribosomal RNA small subunit methyltransferase A [Oxobacter pfennigii]
MNDLIKSIRTRSIIEKYGFRFNKSLGQNFLIDDLVLKTIIEAAEITKDDSVLEIGPGIGTLTLELSGNAGKVMAIEVDKNLIPILSDVLKDAGNVKLYEGDALKVNIKEAAGDFLNFPITICANLPYYITTPLITKFFKESIDVKNIVVMVQKEVAERMAAQPGGKDYGALSLLVQYYSKPRIVAKVPPHCFMPRPKVDSVVIKLEINKRPPVEVEDLELFFSIIRDSFNQRRKTLSNSLKSLKLSKEELNTAFEKSGIDPIRRGETLSIEEFARVSNEVYNLRK